MSDGSANDSNFARAYKFQCEGNLAAARELYEFEAIRDPLNVSAIGNLAVICAAERKFAAAIALGARAAAMCPDNASRAQQLCNLSIHFRTLQQHDMALALGEEAVKLDPRNAANLHAYALTLVALRRYEDSLQWFDRALMVDPNFIACRSDRAYAVLHCGDLQAGLRAHASRWLMLPKAHWTWQSDIPQWRGEDLNGKTILVHSEQGFGDSLMFCRYLKALRMAGARVIWATPKQILPLARTTDLADVCIDFNDAEAPEAIDYHCPMMDVALYGGGSWDNIPAAPYINAPNTGRLREDGRKKVGIVWASGQYGLEVGHRKTAHLRDFLAIANINTLRLISLQLGGPEKQIEEEGARALVEDMAPALKSFKDTAEIIAQLDLVVTIDSAVAHLAGAMGKPVFILLPCLPCWRWRDEGDTTPWYPSAQLFRQQSPNSWPEVMGRVVQAVAEFVKE